jgi:hypothetical protein
VQYVFLSFRVQTVFICCWTSNIHGEHEKWPKNLVGKHKRNTTHGGSRGRLEDNIKMHFKEIGCENVEWHTIAFSDAFCEGDNKTFRLHKGG